MTKREIFLKAQEACSDQERAHILEEACRNSPELRSEIESLLSYDWEDDFLEQPPVEVAPDPIVGSSIGPYKVLQVIGEGGMGIVCMAEQRQPIKRRVALKIIKLGMDTRQVITRFEAERQALAMMDHPNIARVIDAGLTQTGRPYFVMELVRGLTLTEFCDKNTLTTPERLKLFAQVCRAVHHAHQKGIIHRDIKPSNVLVTLIDGKPVPKVIDFGIAKATNFRLTENTLFTEFQNFVGTPMYVSPEQMEMSGQDVDTRSDIYSLGVLLYELLTGSTPIERDRARKAAIAEIQRMVMEVEPPKPSTRLSTLSEERLSTVSDSRGCPPRVLRKQVCGELDWIVMKALEKDRTRRYESAFALCEDVQRFLDNEPVTAVAPSAFYRYRKFVCRYRTAVTAALVILGFLITATVVSTWQASVANTARRNAERAEAAKERLRLEAEAARKEEARLRVEAERNVYAADVNLASQALRDNDLGKARRILLSFVPEEPRPDFLGWEWRYLLGKAMRTQQIRELAEHSAAVSCATFLGGNNLLISGSYDGTVRIWNLLTGNQRALHKFENESVVNLAASDDGRYVAAIWRLPGGQKHGLILWDTESGTVLAELDAIDTLNHQRSLAFMPGRPELFFLQAFGRVACYNWETKSLTSVIPGIGAGAIRIDAEGEYLVVNDGDSFRRIKREDPSDSMGIVTGERAECAAVSREGGLVATGQYYTPVIKLFDLADGRHLGDLEGHTAWISGLAFSPDGKTLYSASADQTIRIWDIASRSERGVYVGHTDEVWDLRVSPDGKYLVSAGKDGLVRLWDAEPSVEEDDLPDFLARLKQDSLQPHVASAMLVGVDREKPNLVRVFQVGKGEQTPLNIRENPALCVAVTPSGHRVAVVQPDGITLMNPKANSDGEKIAIDLPHPITEAFVVGAGLLRLEPSLGYLRLIELERGEANLIAPLEIEEDSLLTATPAGDLLAIGSRLGTVDLVTLPERKVRRFRPQRQLTSMMLSYDGTRLYTTDTEDAFLRIWDVRTLEPIGQPMRSQLLAIHSLAQSPDGKRLLTGANGEVTIWDAERQRELPTILSRTRGKVDKLCFVSDNTLVGHLIDKLAGGEWTIWRAPSWEEIEKDLADFIGERRE